jgi:hypothetical protein
MKDGSNAGAANQSPVVLGFSLLLAFTIIVASIAIGLFLSELTHRTCLI